VVKHITDPVPHILDVKPDLPTATESVIEKAMAKDRDERFPTVKSLADALAAVARGETPDLTTSPAMTRTAIKKTMVSKPGQELAATVMAKRGAETQVGGETVAAARAAAPVRKSGLGIGIGIAVVVVLAIGAVAVFLLRDKIPLLAGPAPTQTTAATLPIHLPTDTVPVPVVKPTETASLPVDTPVPTATATTAVTSLPVLGGADQIAFLNGNNIWTMNVDGTNLRQLTQDGATKHDLQWMPDGQTLVYISGTLVQTVSFTVAGLPSTITNFVEAQALDAFQISPDEKNVAISLNHELFVVPFDLNTLAKARSRSDLIAMKGCYKYNDLGTYGVRWSSDSSRLAVGVVGNDNGRQVDLVRVFDVGVCTGSGKPVRTLDTFPGARFTMIGYNAAPIIPDFDWNGVSLFLVNSYYRNKFFGYQYVYNLETFRAVQLNPLGGAGCCYADMHWSPDGTYVAFGYQDYNLADKAKTQLFYLPYGTINEGGTHTPFNLPADFFKNPREYPDPALRPAKK